MFRLRSTGYTLLFKSLGSVCFLLLFACFVSQIEACLFEEALAMFECNTNWRRTVGGPRACHLRLRLVGFKLCWGKPLCTTQLSEVKRSTCLILCVLEKHRLWQPSKCRHYTTVKFTADNGRLQLEKCGGKWGKST